MIERPARDVTDPRYLDRPLAGVRVIDMVAGAAAAIGRHLRELGADVLRVEPRDGMLDRRHGAVTSRAGLEFATANLGKSAIALDLADSGDRNVFDSLVGEADILVENVEPGSTDGDRLDAAGLSRRFPELVVLSVSNFGQSGSMRDWQATDPVFHALSGELSRSGIPGRAPLLPPGELAYACAVPQAVYVLLVAFYRRLMSGLGDHLDFSLLDGATQALDPGYGMAGSAATGLPPSQWDRGRIEAREHYPILPCADGHVRLCILKPGQWKGMFEWMGRPEAFADPSFQLMQKRFTTPTLLPAIARFIADMTRAQVEEGGQRHGVPVAGVLHVKEALQSPQLVARKAFSAIEIAPGISPSFPDGVMEIDGVRAGIQAPPPALTPPVDFRWTAGERLAAPPRILDLERPLAGLRVLDLGVIVVGGEQARLLADQGADVVKVENPAFPDGSRQTRDGSILSLSFAAGRRNQRGLSINLRDAAGKALFLRLAANADVILSNFKPGTMASLGLDDATLLSFNPRLVIADSSAFGPMGPWSNRLGYGPLVRASAGLTAQWCYPGEPESFSDAITVYPDHVSARIGIVGVLALLIRRTRADRGGTVSVSQAEVVLNHMAAQIAEAELAHAGQAVDREPVHDAPWGVFPCSGVDEWCVVTVRDDTDWQSLCEVIERRDLLADPQLATREGRDAARERIDQAVGAWLAQRAPQQAMALLQAARIPAAAMLRVAELPDFAYFRDRALFRPVRHPHVGHEFLLEARPARSNHLPDPPERPAPLMGEHSAEILREWLDLSDAEIAHLIEARVVDTMMSVDASGAAREPRQSIIGREKSNAR